jgi:hypothetical protein
VTGIILLGLFLSLVGTSIMLLTVQFPFPEAFAVSKWGKTKEKGGKWYEASTCFVERDVSEKYIGC